jgi:phage shock protein A
VSLLRRFTFTVRARLNALLSRTSGPGAELDYSDEQMRDELQDVTRGIADVTTQKKRLDIHRNRLRSNVGKHDTQARAALQEGRDDLARRTLEELESSGQPESVLDDGDSIDQELDRLSSERAVENELATLRAEMDERDAVEEAAE